MTTPLIDEDMIHNWDISAYDSVRSALTAEQCESVQSAFIRHHRKGTSAREEAKALNAAFAL